MGYVQKHNELYFDKRLWLYTITYQTDVVIVDDQKTYDFRYFIYYILNSY